MEIMEEIELDDKILRERGNLERIFELTKSFQDKDLIDKSRYIDKLIVSFMRKKALKY